MAKSNYPHKQRSGGSNRGALIALLVLLIIAAGGSQKLTYFAKVSGDAPNSKDVQAANVVFTISIVD